MLSIFIDLNGNEIHTDSTHLSWIVDNIQDFEQIRLKEEIKKYKRKL